MASCSVVTAPALGSVKPAAVCFPVVRRGRLPSRGVRCSAGQGGVKVPAKLAELWEAAKGAPPLAVLAGVAAAVAIYKVGSGLLAPRPPPDRRLETQAPPPPPLPEPVQVGEITEEELRQYDGSDPEKPLLMAIKGQIYDVSQSRMFYGPGGAYALFAGKDASRALAKMSFEQQDLNGDISDLTPMELSSLNDWEYKFTSKYVKVGPLRARRAREKQSHRGGGAARGADAATPPSRGRVRSRIQFKPSSPVALGRPSVSANRVSPKNRPWAKKTVMFPNPAFHASTSYTAADACATPSPSKKQKRSYKARSPVATRQTPPKFLVKTPPSALGSKLRSHGKALPVRPAVASPPPPPKAQASPAKSRRCSFSPSRLATRLVSPIKARLSLGRSRDSGVGAGGGPMSGLKQRPGVSMTVRTVSSRISSR